MYTHNKHVVDSGQIALDATADGLASFTPGTTPVVLRSAAIIVSVDTTVTTVDVDIKRRPTAGSTTAEVVIDRISVPVSVQGKGFYVVGLNTEIAPGEELVAVVTVHRARAGTSKDPRDDEVVGTEGVNSDFFVVHVVDEGVGVDGDGIGPGLAHVG